MAEASRRAPDDVDGALAAFVAGLKAAPRLGVALSGGCDSVVLLHALCRLRESHGFALSALHVHHGLSAHADTWAAFCRELCAGYEMALEIIRVDVPQGSGEGLEAAARRVRHAAFSDANVDLLALAHHRDDQAETVLLNLLRGAGVAGAAGMHAARPKRRGDAPGWPQARGPVLVRPLLAVPRRGIEDYAARHGLRWIDDESNGNTHFRRNFLRREILPRLEEKFVATKQNLARAAAHFADAATLLGELAAIDMAQVASAAGRLTLAGVNALTPLRAANLLRHAWTAAGFRAPDSAWIAEALRQLATADSLSELELSTADGALRVYRGEIHVIAHLEPPPAVPIAWSGEHELAWGGGRVVFSEVTGAGIRRSALIAGKCLLKARGGGERLRPDAKRPTRSLRKLLQEAALPPWERERLPFLWCDDRLLWVGAIGVECAAACAPGEVGIVPRWRPD